MSRISQDAVAKALIAAQAMDHPEKQQLVDEVFRVQPNLLASVLALPSFGIAMPKADFALDVLFVCYLAMKESGLPWPLITEDEQDEQMRRFTTIAHFGSDLDVPKQNRSMQHYIAGHPEKPLLAYVMTEAAKWTARVAPEESDKYVLLTIWNLVNCIPLVALPSQKAKRSGAPKRRKP